MSLIIIFKYWLSTYLFPLTNLSKFLINLLALKIIIYNHIYNYIFLYNCYFYNIILNFITILDIYPSNYLICNTQFKSIFIRNLYLLSYNLTPNINNIININEWNNLLLEWY